MVKYTILNITGQSIYLLLPKHSISVWLRVWQCGETATKHFIKHQQTLSTMFDEIFQWVSQALKCNYISPRWTPDNNNLRG